MIGDAADAFGALNAGHTAYYQAEVASKNIVKLIRTDGRARLAPEIVPLNLKNRDLSKAKMGEKEKIWATIQSGGGSNAPGTQLKEEETLERYEPPAPSIKVSIGPVRLFSSFFHFSFCPQSTDHVCLQDRAIYQRSTEHGWKNEAECPLDLGAPNMWKRRGLFNEDMTI